MKRILLISNRVMHYRVSLYNEFARRFREIGWDLSVRSDALQSENPYPLDFDFKELEFGFGRYKREIEQVDPDVVIVFLHMRDLMIWPLIHWLRLKKVPVVFWTKGLNLDKGARGISYWLYRYLHRVCDGIILYSPHELQYIAERNRYKVFVANNTINFDEYPQVLESADDIKRDLGIPFRKVVLSVGRMGAEGGRKKIDHLIRVFGEVDDQDVGLVIVGSGLGPDLLARINKRNTIYLGEVYDPQNVQISRIFKMADVFCLPGHVGLGLNQAFFWGLPVVTEEGGQPPEIHYLVDGRNGFIVPNGDIGELKTKILRLLTDDAARRQFSRHARKDILANASVGNMFNGFRRCIEAVTSSRAVDLPAAGGDRPLPRSETPIAQDPATPLVKR